MTQENSQVANAVYEEIFNQIFPPTLADETIGDYFKRVGIDPAAPPVGYMKLLDKVRTSDTHLNSINIWVVAMRFTAHLFAMRNSPNAQIAIAELTKTMPEFPLEALLDQQHTQSAHAVLTSEDDFKSEASPQNQSSNMKQILHVECGTDLWEPTASELASITEQFQAVLANPKGGIIATRKGVTTNLIDTTVDPSGLVVALSTKSLEQATESKGHALFLPAAGTVVPPDSDAQ